MIAIAPDVPTAPAPSPAEHAAGVAASLLERENAERCTKRAAADLIRAVATAPDATLPAAVVEAKRKLLKTE